MCAREIGRGETSGFLDVDEFSFTGTLLNLRSLCALRQEVLAAVFEFLCIRW